MRFLILIIIFLNYKNSLSRDSICVSIPILVSEFYNKSINQVITHITSFQMKEYEKTLSALYKNDTMLRDLKVDTISNFKYRDSVNQIYVRTFFKNYIGFEYFEKKCNIILKQLKIILNHAMGYDFITEIEKNILESIKNKKACYNDLLIFYSEYFWNRFYRSNAYNTGLIGIDDLNILKNEYSKKVFAKNINFFIQKGYKYAYIPSIEQIINLDIIGINKLIIEMKNYGLTNYPDNKLQKKLINDIVKYNLNSSKSYFVIAHEKNIKNSFAMIDTSICY